VKLHCDEQYVYFCFSRHLTATSVDSLLHYTAARNVIIIIIIIIIIINEND